MTKNEKVIFFSHYSEIAIVLMKTNRNAYAILF